MHTELTPWGSLSADDLAAWDDLARRCNAAPDAYPAWSRSLVASHGIPPGELWLACSHDANGLRLVCPLRARHVRKLGVPLRLVEPLLSTYSLHQTVLSDLDPVAAITVLGDSIDRQFADWTFLYLNRLVEGDATHCAWNAWTRQRRCLAEEMRGLRPPYLRIDTDWESYLRGQSRKFRSNLHRERRNLERAGSVRIDFVQEPDRMARALEALVHVEHSSWKTGERTSLVARPWEERFYALLAQEYAAMGNAVLSILSLDGIPIAFDLMLTGGGRAFGLKSSFDDRYRKLSPGSVLEAAVMQWVFESGFEEYDFLGTDEPYKLQWTDTVRQDVSLSIVNCATSRGRLYAAGKRAAAWLRR